MLEHMTFKYVIIMSCCFGSECTETDSSQLGLLVSFDYVPITVKKTYGRWTEVNRIWKFVVITFVCLSVFFAIIISIGAYSKLRHGPACPSRCLTDIGWLVNIAGHMSAQNSDTLAMCTIGAQTLL